MRRRKLVRVALEVVVLGDECRVGGLRIREDIAIRAGPQPHTVHVLRRVALPAEIADEPQGLILIYEETPGCQIVS